MDLANWKYNWYVAIPDRWYQEIKDKNFIMDPQLEEKMARVYHKF